MNKHLVSIITPLYNGGNFVEDTIKSVQDQSHNEWEMLIIDDCSKDNGPEIVKKYARKDKRIKLIQLKTNSGSSGARNGGIKAASGRYISFLDSDDFWEKDFLSNQLSFIEEKKASLVFSSFNRVDEITKEPLLKPLKVREKVNYSDLLKTNDIGCSTAIYDSNKIGKIYFNENLGSNRDDFEYWLRILKMIDYAYGNSNILVNYRIRKDSVTANKKTMIIPQWNVYRKIEHLSFLKSLYYLLNWGFYGFLKYKK